MESRERLTGVMILFNFINFFLIWKQSGFWLEQNAAPDCSLFASVLEPAGPMKLSPEAQDWVTSRDKPRKNQDGTRRLGISCYLLICLGAWVYLPFSRLVWSWINCRAASVRGLLSDGKGLLQGCKGQSPILPNGFFHFCSLRYILKVFKDLEGQAALASTFLSYSHTMIQDSHSLFDYAWPGHVLHMA